MGSGRDRKLRTSGFVWAGWVEVEGGINGCREESPLPGVKVEVVEVLGGEGKSAGGVNIGSPVGVSWPTVIACSSWGSGGAKGHSDRQNLGTAPKFPSPGSGTVTVFCGSIVP